MTAAGAPTAPASPGPLTTSGFSSPAALALYIAAFIGHENDIAPFMRAIHQQSEGAAWAAAAACIAAVLLAIERLVKI
jgi:hypothetical protein